MTNKILPFENFSVDDWLPPGTLLHNKRPVTLFHDEQARLEDLKKPFFLREPWPIQTSFSRGNLFLFLEADFRLVTPSVFGEEFKSDYGIFCTTYHLLKEEKRYTIELEIFPDSDKGLSNKQIEATKTSFMSYFEIMKVGK